VGWTHHPPLCKEWRDSKKPHIFYFKPTESKVTTGHFYRYFRNLIQSFTLAQIDHAQGTPRMKNKKTKEYKPPQQPRAEQSETRFLNAFNEILKTKGYNATTIQEIAQHAGLHKGAFLKRFGTKRAALIELYERYCLVASETIAQGHAQIGQKTLLHDLCFGLSQSLENIQRAHFSANRAMHEFFMEELQVAPQTKRIFKETVALMQAIQAHYLADQACTASGAYAAAQLLVTLNYNYVMQAMPAFPQEPNARHSLIANLVIRALWT
jgi:AcrR family transcriptional regulator